jgi:hypothetical protein
LAGIATAFIGAGFTGSSSLESSLLELELELDASPALLFFLLLFLGFLFRAVVLGTTGVDGLTSVMMGDTLSSVYCTIEVNQKVKFHPIFDFEFVCFGQLLRNYRDFIWRDRC